MKTLIRSTVILAALTLSTGCIHRHKAFTDKTVTDLACKIVQGEEVDVRCHVVQTNTQKW